METIVPDAWVSKPRSLHILRIICPIVQINPPTQNALKQFFSIGELGVFLSTYSWYAFLVSKGFIYTPPNYLYDLHQQ